MSRHRSTSRLRTSRGQALTETVVVMLALALLMVLVPILGKYQDISHQALVASRYVAWQSTVTNDVDGSGFADAADTLAEVRTRFFSEPLAAVRSGVPPEDDGTQLRALWVDHAGRGMVESLDDVYVSYGGGEQSSIDPSNGYTGHGRTEDMMLLPMLVGPDEFDLNDRGLYRGVVQVALANLDDAWLGESLSEMNLTIRRQTDLLPGTWAASSANEVRQRVVHDDMVFPIQIIKDIQIVLEALTLILESGNPDEVSSPLLGDADFWEDFVPEDRVPEDD